MNSNLSLNFFILFFLFSLIFSHLVIKISNSIFYGRILDKDFKKPQAFHKVSTPRIGGIIFFSLFLTILLINKKFFEIFFFEYLFLTTFFLS